MRFVKIALAVGTAVALFLAAMAIAAHAKVKDKTPQARVSGTFRIIGPPRQRPGVLRGPGNYAFDHDVWHTAGKAIIHKECPLDRFSDPGEANCRVVWAHI